MSSFNALPSPDHRVCETLTGLTLNQLPRDGSLGRMRQYDQGTYVWQAGDRADRIYFLQRGHVAVMVSDPQGREITLQSVLPGEPFGELCYCSPKKGRRETNSRVLLNSQVVEISLDDFVGYLQRHRDVLTALMVTFCLRLSDAERRAEILTYRGAEERLGRLLLQLARTRGIRIRAEGATPPRYSNGRLVFDITLDPGETWHTCINFIALVDGEELMPKHTDAAINVTPAGKEMASFLKLATHLQSSNREVEQIYQQALVDLAALRIPVDDGELVWIPAAGIPWFVAVFGRDPLLASLQTMAVAPNLAQGTLLKLAEFQATEKDDWRDAEPGKILHKLRQGELAHLHQIPNTPYYGAINTTILWIVTLSETYRWTGNHSLLNDCYAPLEKALTWIEQYGDLDGDGFVEYCSRSKDGIQNQGWKDSGDSIRDADGNIVKAPIALCETQGQVYDAWRRAADFYDVRGQPNRAQELRQKADELYQRFNARFWMEDEGFYCLGLDGNKQQIRSITSNPGHLLWSGIVPPERAKQLVQRLFQPDLWCGWGIRTLSAKNPAYDPLGYHTGSVWAHDNSFIVAGLKRYGYLAEANRIAEGLFAAASMFQNYQMPELFGGIERQSENFPVPYSDANIPQAWAAGAILWLISSVLGLEADASNRQLHVQPVLPEWLPDVQLTNVFVGDARVDLRFWREDEQTKWEVTHQHGELNLCPSDHLK